MKRRTEKQLKDAIEHARSNRFKAVAYFNLGLFHDNNARESKAIPNYLNALRLGLEQRKKSQALAWLASSLYKTGKSKKALVRVKQSRNIADEALQKFLVGLEKRIKVRMKQSRISS